MRFPLRLSAALERTRLSTLLVRSSRSPLIFHLSIGDKGLARAKSQGAPVVWIGGEEPLLHPEIGGLANGLVEDNRHVFVHTDGYNLRQRIHAFRPDSRLFLTLEFAGLEETHNRVMGRHDAFRRSLEGIRAAKLSGFLVAAHFTVAPQTDACEIGELIECLDSKDVDGFVVSSGSQVPTGQNAALSEILDEARAMIRCNRWENFSRLLEESYTGAVSRRTPEKISAPGEGAYEEGD
jgi:MoaA/NifB/PqqE/SkfB family radical SAM enzyme